MSILTIAWSMCGAASLMLGLMHIVLWFHERRSTVYLLTSLASCSAAATAMLELSLMHAASTTIYGELVRWQNLVVFLMLIPLVWAVFSTWAPVAAGLPGSSPRSGRSAS